MGIRVCIWFVVMASLIAVLGYVISEKTGSENKGPRYTLEAFKRQWTINSPNPRAHFNAFYKMEGGYTVHYGDGVSLFIVMQNDAVAGVRIRYDKRSDEGGDGGPRFLLLVNTAINVGTFRWPPERVEHVRNAFGIGLQPKTYRYFHSFFTRKRTPPDKWEFTLDYVTDKPEEYTPGPMPALPPTRR